MRFPFATVRRTAIVAACLLSSSLAACGDGTGPRDPPTGEAQEDLVLQSIPIGGTTVINFEDVTAGTPVTTQYAAKGVVFPDKPYAESSTVAHSGARVLRSTYAGVEFDTEPLRIDFTSTQAHVKLFAGRQAAAVSGILRAYNASGALLVQDGPRAVASGGFTTAFEVNTSTPTITRVTLEYTDAYGAPKFIDDLELSGTAPPPPPTTAPVVHVATPTAGQAFDLPASVAVQGSAQGDGIVSGQVDVTQSRPPGSLAPRTMTFGLSLSGTGSTRQFASTVFLPVGDVQVRAQVSNSADLVGSDAVMVSNLPAALRARLAAEGGTASVGAFAFGGGGVPSCSYAVYANAAIASVNGTSYAVRDAVLAKWLLAVDSSAYPRLGCPIAEAEAVQGGTMQRFEHGRIYASSAGAYVVSPEVAPLVDALGGTAALGMPIEDSSANATTNTWMFQRFRAPGEQELMATTLEIRGTPAVLLVERQGGDRALYGDQSASNAVSLTRRAPTIVDRYPCSGPSGPCTIAPLSNGARFYDPGLRCGNRTFGVTDLTMYVDTGYSPMPEWVSIEPDPYHQTGFAGIVAHAERSDQDNPWGHETHDDPCWSLNPLDIITGLFDYPFDKKICPSDLDIHVRPLPAYEQMMVTGVDNVAIEVEEEFVDLGFLGGWGKPSEGDLVFSSGRFIVDCGHNDPNWRTEIHPPSVMAVMHSDDYDRRPATFADIWVNGFYSGEPVEFDLYAPPRPSANATLAYAKPTGNVGVDVSVVESIQGGDHLHVKVTASTRHVTINPLGEMMMQSGRNYEGQWRVFWRDAPYENDVAVFARGADGAIRDRRLDGATWSDWVNLGGTATAPPAATVDNDGAIHLVVRGSDNALWQSVRRRDAWNDWTRIGGSVASAPAVATDVQGIVWAFARGLDNNVQLVRFLNGAWSSWSTLPGTVSSAPAAVVIPQGNRVWLFARGASNEVLVRDHTPTIANPDAWSGWTSLGGTTITAPAAAVRQDGRVWLFGVRPDHSVWYRAYLSGGWQPWTSIGGQANGAPAATVDAAGRLYVVVPAPDGGASYRVLDGNIWSNWMPLGGSASGGVAAIFH